jgi:hypothetical protein
MSEQGGGYGNPPERTRFKPGVSGNPKGRPPRKPLPAAEALDRVMNTTTEYREGGQIKTATRLEVIIKAAINRAIKGNMKAAELLLELRGHAQRWGDVGAHRLIVTDWMPAHRGQTAEQKTREFAAQGNFDQPGWWEQKDDTADKK